jgi:hypothetical protein
MQCTCNSVIIGGDSNIIYGGDGAFSCNNAIGGGLSNQIGSISVDPIRSVCNAAIVGGFANVICGLVNSAIGGGEYNKTFQSNTAIAGGYSNEASGNRSVAYNYYTQAFAGETAVVGISKFTDNFHIDHPDPAKRDTYNLIHRTIESPSKGENLYRFQVNTCNCEATLQLPSYYKFLNCNDYVSVSPTNHFGNGYGVMNQDQSQINICTNYEGTYDVIVIGTRKDKEAQKTWVGIEIDNPVVNQG